MDTEVLGLIFTEKCNFRCRHCCNESSPQGEHALSLDEMLVHVAEAAATGRFREIGLSGGEPFLFPRQLLQVVSCARECGLSSSVTTNGFWGFSTRHALRTLEPLVAAGLASVNVSISPFHLEFTSVDRIVTAASVAYQLGLLVRVNVVQTPTFTVEQVREHFGSVADQVEFVPMPCIPAGRAAGEVASADLPIRREVRMGNCRSFFAKVAVTATGDVYPCCSPGGFTPPLRGGSLATEPLAEIIRRMEGSTLIRVLEALGPSFFLPFVSARLGRDLVAEGLVDQCHLCHTLMSEPELTRVVDSALTQLDEELRQLDLDLEDIAALARNGP